MRIGIIGCGMMGAAVAALTQARGAQVLVLLEGRSAASRARAAELGLQEGSAAQVGACDVVLSIVPPDAADDVVQVVLPHLGAETIFVEANAVNPDDARRLCTRVSKAGHHAVDGGIVGPAPSLDGSRGPVFYFAGERAEDCTALARYGLEVRTLDGAPGSASALKMTFAGVSKGLTGLMAQMLAYAKSEGVAEPAIAQLRESNPGAVAWAERQFPLLDRKAGRWVQEMEILASLTAGIAGGQAHFTGMAEVFAAIAADPDWADGTLGVLG